MTETVVICEPLRAVSVYYAQGPCDYCRRHAKVKLVDGAGRTWGQVCPDHRAYAVAIIDVTRLVVL